METKVRTGLLADPFSKKHDTGPGHPESAARYDAIWNALDKAGLPDRTVKLVPHAATEDDVARCHSRDYIASAKQDIANKRSQLRTGDTSISKQSWDVAMHAVGSAMAAVDSVFEKSTRNALAVVRPPGHHATADRGMGFCIFNNVAVAARYAQHKFGVKNVLIADWDVHHGNGTQDIFYSDGSVFFFSTHQYPWYPGSGLPSESGVGPGKGRTMNCPFPAGAGHQKILGAFRHQLVPEMEKFKPELVLLSAGFDSREGDPLGRFRLTDADFAALTKLMMEMADKHAAGRLVSLLEGGYNLDGVGQAVAAHLAALAG